MIDPTLALIIDPRVRAWSVEVLVLVIGAAYCKILNQIRLTCLHSHRFPIRPIVVLQVSAAAVETPNTVEGVAVWIPLFAELDVFDFHIVPTTVTLKFHTDLIPTVLGLH
jgi:hypothetical protein